MLRIFENQNLNAEVQTIIKGDDYYFKGKNICDALGYENTRKAIRDNVSPKYRINHEVLPRGTASSSFHPQTIFISEPGLYQLIFSSKLPAAVEFQEWVLEDVLPKIRKTGKYAVFNTKNPLVFKMEDENDLHYKVVDFIKRFYPDLIHIAGLGELQYTDRARIEGKKKGYIKGQPDLIITNYHKWYSGLCIEMKTPKGTGSLFKEQIEILDRFKKNGFKILVSNDYDEIIQEIIEYCRGIRIPCPHCCKRFVKDETLAAHLKWFHRIEN